ASGRFLVPGARDRRPTAGGRPGGRDHPVHHGRHIPGVWAETDPLRPISFPPVSVKAGNGSRDWRISMNTAVSADGTKIAFDQTGDGPPVILVVGAFNERPTGAPLAKAIESEFTVFNYDR